MHTLSQRHFFRHRLRRECRLAECDLVRHIGDCGVEELPRLLKDMQKEIMLRDKEQSSSDMREMFLHRDQLDAPDTL